MRRLYTGVIVFDAIDIICISFSVGSSIAYLTRTYKNYKQRRNGVDPIVTELKEKSRLTMVSVDGQPLKLPLVRGGGEELKTFSLAIKNKKLAVLLRAMLYVKTNNKQILLLRVFFASLNGLLTSSLGLRIGVGGSLDWTQFLLFAFPSTISGFMIAQAIANPLAAVFLPLAVLYGRGIEEIPDPYEKCKILCKAAEEYHNRQLALEMQNLNPLIKDASTALQLPIDEVPLVCVEEKFSLLQRYKLRQLLKSEKVKNRVKHFSDFIKKFPECDANSEAVYQQVVEKITE